MAYITTAIEEASSVVQSIFRIGVEKSELKIYSVEDWLQFCDINKFTREAEGVYIPAKYKAYVRDDSSSLLSNVFHEYFGHGLFCEHSRLGKTLCGLIEDGKDGDGFLFEPKSESQQFGFCQKNIGNYEGIAMWLESFLCDATGNLQNWNFKKERMQKDYVELYEYFKSIEQNYGSFTLMAQMGFPKYYDGKILTDTLQRIFGRKFAECEMILLVGSRKPESDIDLLIVGEGATHTMNNGWLDIGYINREEYLQRIRLFDIEATIGLYTGEAIYDPHGLLQMYKHIVDETPISPEAIEHNVRTADAQKSYFPEFANDAKKLKLSQGYYRSFYSVAQGLRQGLKLTNFEEINRFLDNNPAVSRDIQRNITSF